VIDEPAHPKCCLRALHPRKLAVLSSCLARSAVGRNRTRREDSGTKLIDCAVLPRMRSVSPPGVRYPVGHAVQKALDGRGVRKVIVRAPKLVDIVAA
jgi:hypothetical protein